MDYSARMQDDKEIDALYNAKNQTNWLFKAVESSYRTLEPFRHLNKALVEEYAGASYGGPGRAKFDNPLNLMNQVVEAYTMTLVANRPRILASAKNVSNARFAKQYEIAINNYIETIGLEYVLRRWVLDSIFCIGITKVHTADSGIVRLYGDSWVDPGRPFCSNISLDNFVYDVSAPKFSQVKFAGDMYRVPFSALKDPDMYDQEAVEDLQPTSKYAIDDDRLERISRGFEVDPDEFEPSIDLADIWIRSEQKICTYAVDNIGEFKLKGKRLAEIPFSLPEGPYDILGFDDVPENIMPTSIASQLATLSRTINNIVRKQSRRAKSEKRMHTYSAAGAKAAKIAQREGDDAWIECEDPQQLGQIDVGGVSPNANQFLLQTMEMFDRCAGNLPAMLGLGAQSDTVGQEELIHGAVGKKGANMQYRVVDGAVKIIRKLGRMLFEDEFTEVPGTYQIPGAEGYSIDMTWTPEDREGTPDDYDLNIDLYSMPYQSPQQKMNAINSMLTQKYLPFTQAIMAQGGVIDFQKMIEIDAELLNDERIKEIIKFNSLPPEEPVELSESGKPSNTTRTNIRKNIPTGGTMQSRNQVLQQAWANTDTPQQTASMGVK